MCTDPDRNFIFVFVKAAVILLGAFLLALYLGARAHAQTAPELQCAPTAKLEKNIGERYGETLAAVGMLAPDDSVMTILANGKTGTYTILLRRPGGVSCILFAGKAFTLVPLDKAVPGTDL